MCSTASNRPVKPLVLHAAQIANMAPEGFPDPGTGGNVTWKTLVSKDKTETDTFTVGIATCPPGRVIACPASSSSDESSGASVPSLYNTESLGDAGFLELHQHTHAEIYHVISGTGIVCINGQEYEARQGSVVFIPGDAEHGIFNTGKEDLVWLYVFAAGGFEEITYRFSEKERIRKDGDVKAKL
jgi:mannose-6-phosphate isomerase-like protein (cupin superfamily)